MVEKLQWKFAESGLFEGKASHIDHSVTRNDTRCATIPLNLPVVSRYETSLLRLREDTSFSFVVLLVD